MPTIFGKCWGTSSIIFAKNNVEVHRIEGKLGGKSSNHRHMFKISMFFVERGSIKISIEKNDYNLIDETILREHQSTIIKPKEYHWFEILEEGTVAYEIYHTELTEDIDRKNCGSLNSLPPTA